jgi:UDP-N-acetyl-2-amino-2-deoxyglucuronate dehydrogenase
MKTIGFAIVGCGNIAPFHADALDKIPNAKLVAICDKMAYNTEHLTQKFNATPYTDYAEMLKQDDIDVVNICLPSSLHEPFAIQAAEAGKHIIVEKPLDITLEKCDAIIAACESNNVKLAVIFPSRFKESAIVVKQAIEAGRFGKITLADAHVKWYRDQEYYDAGGWRGTWKYDGGGALMNQSIHYIDLLQSFMGPIESVYAHCETLARDIEVEDTAVATLKFKNGALGVIEGATSIYPGLDVRIGIHGTDGSAVLDGETLDVWEFKDANPEDIILKAKLQKTGSSGAKDPTAFMDSKGHQLQFEDMIEAIQLGRDPEVSGYEGRKSVEIISAIYQSSKEGKPILISN